MTYRRISSSTFPERPVVEKRRNEKIFMARTFGWIIFAEHRYPSM